MTDSLTVVAEWRGFGTAPTEPTALAALLHALDTPEGPPEDRQDELDTLFERLTAQLGSSAAAERVWSRARSQQDGHPAAAAPSAPNTDRAPRRRDREALHRVESWIQHWDRLLSGSSGATRAEFRIKREAAECLARDLRSVVFTPDSEFSDEEDA